MRIEVSCQRAVVARIEGQTWLDADGVPSVRGELTFKILDADDIRFDSIALPKPTADGAAAITNFMQSMRPTADVVVDIDGIGFRRIAAIVRSIRGLVSSVTARDQFHVALHTRAGIKVELLAALFGGDATYSHHVEYWAPEFSRTTPPKLTLDDCRSILRAPHARAMCRLDDWSVVSEEEDRSLFDEPWAYLDASLCFWATVRLGMIVPETPPPAWRRGRVFGRSTPMVEVRSSSRTPTTSVPAPAAALVLKWIGRLNLVSVQIDNDLRNFEWIPAFFASLRSATPVDAAIGAVHVESIITLGAATLMRECCALNGVTGYVDVGDARIDFTDRVEVCALSLMATLPPDDEAGPFSIDHYDSFTASRSIAFDARPDGVTADDWEHRCILASRVLLYSTTFLCRDMIKHRRDGRLLALLSVPDLAIQVAAKMVRMSVAAVDIGTINTCATLIDVIMACDRRVRDGNEQALTELIHALEYVGMTDDASASAMRKENNFRSTPLAETAQLNLRHRDATLRLLDDDDSHLARLRTCAQRIGFSLRDVAKWLAYP